jgi:hypothetical protein
MLQHLEARGFLVVVLVVSSRAALFVLVPRGCLLL